MKRWVRLCLAAFVAGIAAAAFTHLLRHLGLPSWAAAGASNGLAFLWGVLASNLLPSEVSR